VIVIRIARLQAHCPGGGETRRGRFLGQSESSSLLEAKEDTDGHGFAGKKIDADGA
jgi:hypothetical protein